MRNMQGRAKSVRNFSLPALKEIPAGKEGNKGNTLLIFDYRKLLAVIFKV